MTLTQRQNHNIKIASLSVSQQKYLKGKCKLKPKPQNSLPVCSPKEQEGGSVWRRLLVLQGRSISHEDENHCCSSKQCLSTSDAIQGNLLSVSVESFCQEVIAEETIIFKSSVEKSSRTATGPEFHYPSTRWH